MLEGINDPAQHLQAALAHIDAALTAFDPDTGAQYYSEASKLSGEIRAQLRVLELRG